ncbi:MAG: hypothetical protein QM695_12605 [Micropruina sp.]
MAVRPLAVLMSGTVIGPNDATSLMVIRRVRSLATIDQVRLVAAALVLFLLVDLVRLSLMSPVPLQDAALITTMDVVGYLAILVALWRPLLGLALAAVPLATALVWTSTSLDAMLLTVVPALVLTQQARRNALLITGGLACYVALRVLSYAGDDRGALLLSLAGPLALGLLLGWIGQAVHERRDRAARTALDQAVEEGRIRADERRALSADLHDVVVHHLFDCLAAAVVGAGRTGSGGAAPHAGCGGARQCGRAERAAAAGAGVTRGPYDRRVRHGDPRAGRAYPAHSGLRRGAAAVDRSGVRSGRAGAGGRGRA